jgi:hypothetical protein
MPNHLGYCGGNDNEVLFEHASEGRADRRLTPLLGRFTGAVPYLRTIAAANGIADPFDPRVVEAYWLGNDLLAGVEAADLYRSLEERFGRALPATVRAQVLRKPPAGAKPYHLFHVVDVYRHLESAEVGMAAMESCRVSWAQVTAVDGPTLMGRRRPWFSARGSWRWESRGRSGCSAASSTEASSTTSPSATRSQSTGDGPARSSTRPPFATSSAGPRTTWGSPTRRSDGVLARSEREGAHLS